MSNAERPCLERERHVNEAMAEYYAEVEKGERPEAESWLARYPDIAEELRAFLADKGSIEVGNAVGSHFNSLGLVFHGRPGERSVDSSRSWAAVRLCQLAVPNGLPRRAERRTDSNSACVCARLTNRSQSPA